MKKRSGFTLVELMVVILIIGILAAVAVPLMRGRIDRAKWSEANASCGTIWSGIRAYIAEKGPDFDYSAVQTGLDDAATCQELGFNLSDLEGTYFSQNCYTITRIVAEPPACTIEADSSASTKASPPAANTATFVSDDADGDPWNGP